MHYCELSWAIYLAPPIPLIRHLTLRLRSSSPCVPPFILSIGRDVSGSAEPALVLYALGTEHLPRCSHMDAILRFVR